MTTFKVFDLDHTLVTCNVSFEFGKHLYQKGWISFPKMLTLCWFYGRHKLGSLSIDQLHQNIFSRLFHGVPLKKIEAEVSLFLKKLPSFISLSVTERITPGSMVLSSSPDFLVGPISDWLGIESWKATSYIVDKHGKLCHIGAVMDGQRKAETLSETLSQRGSDQKEVVFFTDSILDLPVFKLAKTVVAVRPDRELKKLAFQNKWEILDEFLNQPSSCGNRRD